MRLVENIKSKFKNSFYSPFGLLFQVPLSIGLEGTSDKLGFLQLFVQWLSLINPTSSPGRAKT